MQRRAALQVVSLGIALGGCFLLEPYPEPDILGVSVSGSWARGRVVDGSGFGLSEVSGRF